ncbi:MAG TPA: CoA transferase [Thermodesulfobacteriota bacterium]
MKPPLDGVRVLDFTLHNAGPFATMLLACMGAEVIKVESAMRLDIHRRPHPVYGRLDVPNFEQVQMRKRSVRLNLKDPRGIELARALAKVSDLVAESFRPGVMDRLGLGYADLSKLNRRIILLSVSAAGQTGPERENPGYAPIFGATGGLGYLTGYEDGPPVEIRHIMDHSVGLSAACGALFALYHQRRTGEGQHVDVSGQEVASSLIGEYLVEYAAGGRSAARMGNADHIMAPHGVYPCAGKDRWVAIAVGSDAEWLGLRAAAGDPGWASDGRFDDAVGRWTHRDEIDRRLAEWTSRHAAEEITRRCQAHGVAAIPSMSPADIHADPQTEARDMLPTIEHPRHGRRRAVRPPWKFSRTPADAVGWSPDLGEHTAEVFGELLGLSAAEIESLVEARVIY